MMETRGLLHVPGATGADGDVVLEDSGQELGPGNAVASAATGRRVLTAYGLRQGTGTRYDLGSIRRGGSQYAVVSDQVESL